MIKSTIFIKQFQKFHKTTAMANAEPIETAFGCAICACSFKVSEQANICTIPCGHVYHESCLLQWFRTQIQQERPSNCPKCRTPTCESQTIRLFLHELISYADIPMAIQDEVMTENTDDNALVSTDDNDSTSDNEINEVLLNTRLL